MPSPRRRPSGGLGPQRLFLALVGVILGGIAVFAFWPFGSSPSVPLPADGGNQAPELGELPEELSREDVREALREAAPYVRMCSKGETGVIRVFLEITGKTGRVKRATVSKHLAGTEVAKCAATIVEQVQFPRFQKETLTVVFPFSLGSPPADGGADAEPGGG